MSNKGQYMGSIFQEFPDIYPKTWTVGVLDGISYNYIDTLEECLRFVLENMPKAQIVIQKKIKK